MHLAPAATAAAAAGLPEIFGCGMQQ
jgi:hypothetical protein